MYAYFAKHPSTKLCRSFLTPLERWRWHGEDIADVCSPKWKHHRRRNSTRAQRGSGSARWGSVAVKNGHAASRLHISLRWMQLPVALNPQHIFVRWLNGRNINVWEAAGSLAKGMVWHCSLKLLRFIQKKIIIALVDIHNTEYFSPGLKKILNLPVACKKFIEDFLVKKSHASSRELWELTFNLTAANDTIIN